MVQTILDKVNHIKYMEELEQKLKPYVILDTTEQAMKSICAG